MGDDLTDEELAALDRIVVRLEVWLEEYGDTDAASVGLVKEELLLMHQIVSGGGALHEEGRADGN